MNIPATIHNTTQSGSHHQECSSAQYANTFNMQQATYPDSNGLNMRHVKNMVKNESVTIQASAPGWIISTAISLMKFMGKSTGTEVDIKFLE